MAGSIRYTVEIDRELKMWIDEEARRRQRSPEDVVSNVLSEAKARGEAMSQMAAEALRQADEGVFVSEEKMTQWFNSLGTTRELPEPEPDIRFRKS